MLTTTSARVATRLIAAPLVLTVLVTGQAASPAHADPAHSDPTHSGPASSSAAGANASASSPVDELRLLREAAREHALDVQARAERRERRERRERAAAERRERQAAAIGQRIVAAAAAQAGKPYVYGSTGPGSFDCSGLTAWAYAAVGIHLPRTSGAQAAVMTRVSDPMPGDLVYMPGHVGIYAGNGQMWHAPHSGDVVRLATIWTSNVTYGRIR